MNRTILRRVSLLLLVVLAPLALDGCVSVGLVRSDLKKPGATDGTVDLAVFQKERDRDARAVVQYPVFSEFFLVDKTGDKLVARSMAARWSLPGLRPGTYRLEMSKRIDERGNIEPLGKVIRKEIEVRAGEKASVDVILEKVPVFWIVLAAITVVILVILSIDWIKEGKIPLPPPPPPLPIPFPAVAVTGSYAPSEPGGMAAAETPAVVDVFPAPGSVVTEPRVTVSFMLTCPLSRDGIEKGTILALGSHSGAIGGVTSWVPGEQLLSFIPTQDFTPGEKVTVTLDLEKVEGESGRHGSGKASTTFEVR
jgi:hypothetical protein